LLLDISTGQYKETKPSKIFASTIQMNMEKLPKHLNVFGQELLVLLYFVNVVSPS